MTETPEEPEASPGEPNRETADPSEVPTAVPTPPSVADAEAPGDAPAAEEPAAELPFAEEPAPRSSRRRWILIGAVVAVVAGGGAAAALLLIGGDKTKPKAKTAHRVIAPPPQTTPTTTATTTAQPTVDQPAVRKLLDRYQRAYNSKDADALSQLFSTDVVRKGGNQTETGRNAVLAEYRKQFKVLDQPKYRLLGLAIATDAKGATATGRYQVTSANGGGRGTISFHIRSENGQPVIDHLDAEPKP